MQGQKFCHKNKIRTNEPKIWKNKNTEAQPKLSGSYKKKCKVNFSKQGLFYLRVKLRKHEI